MNSGRYVIITPVRNDGYRLIEPADWEFVVKLDGDVSLEAVYFENCLQRFEKDRKLGIGGGNDLPEGQRQTGERSAR